MEYNKEIGTNKKQLELKILPMLNYIGYIGVSLMSIAYIGTIIIMVLGFSVYRDLTQTLFFSIVNGIFGLSIIQMFKLQGISYAKNIPENKILLEQYYGSKNKIKKSKSITYYWITTFLKDVVTKLLAFGVSTFGIIYIVIEGSKEYALIWLAIVNLLFFICFGLINLVKAYEFYNTEHMAWIKNKLQESENKE